MEFESNLDNAYLHSYELAKEKLRTLGKDDVCKNAAVSYDEDKGAFYFKYLNKDIWVYHQSGEIEAFDGSKITSSTKALISHYLVTANYEAPTNKPITFKELPNGGAIYCSNFQKRAIDPIVKTFAENFEGFYKACEKLGGEKETYGHASIAINILPLIRVTYVVWQGDDEVPSSGNIFFDQNIKSYLPVEDTVVAASYGSYELIKLSR